MISAAIEVSPEAAAFQAAVNEERLLFGQCTACDKPHYYPRRICPYCSSSAVEWRAASGRGEIYSFSVVRRADPPYAPAYVSLPEGVTLLTNIVDADFDALAIGDKVELVFREVEEGHLAPFFRVAP